MGWGATYPIYRTVIKRRSWLAKSTPETPDDEATESYEMSCFKKTISATDDLSDPDGYFRIEYDPTTESLMTWHFMSDETEEASGMFAKFLRSDNPDASYFGATLPD
jgi:hypothetical protein